MEEGERYRYSIRTLLWQYMQYATEGLGGGEDK